MWYLLRQYSSVANKQTEKCSFSLLVTLSSPSAKYSQLAVFLSTLRRALYVIAVTDAFSHCLTLEQIFVAIHIAAIAATTWILMLNGAVGYQYLDDGTAVSIGLLFISSLIIFVGTGYIALDTGFGWTGYWKSSLDPPNQAYALYTLYQLAPLVFLAIFFLLETFLVLRVLGERKPMRMSLLNYCSLYWLILGNSISIRRSDPFCYRAGFPVCH